MFENTDVRTNLFFHFLRLGQLPQVCVERLQSSGEEQVGGKENIPDEWETPDKTRAAASQVMTRLSGDCRRDRSASFQSLLAAAKLQRILILWASLSWRILSSLHRGHERRKRNAHCTAFRQSLHCLIAERCIAVQLPFLFEAFSS